MSRIKKRIEVLINRLEKGDDIQNRDLKSVLTSDEFSNYESEWENHLDWKSGRNYQYSAIYDEFLHKGDFAYNKAESGRFSKEATENLYREAERNYELGLEQLEAESQINPMIGASYDRSFNTLTSSNTDISYHGMPRRLTSKSLNNQGNVVYSSSGGSSDVKDKVTKRDFKLKALRESLDNFERRGTEDDEIESQNLKINELMKNLKNRK